MSKIEIVNKSGIVLLFHMDQFSDRLKKWRGHRRQKEAASDLDLKLGTYRSWEEGKRTPKKHTLAEIERLMEAHK